MPPEGGQDRARGSAGQQAESLSTYKERVNSSFNEVESNAKEILFLLKGLDNPKTIAVSQHAIAILESINSLTSPALLQPRVSQNLEATASKTQAPRSRPALSQSAAAVDDFVTGRKRTATSLGGANNNHGSEARSRKSEMKENGVQQSNEFTSQATPQDKKRRKSSHIQHAEADVPAPSIKQENASNPSPAEADDSDLEILTLAQFAAQSNYTAPNPRAPSIPTAGLLKDEDKLSFAELSDSKPELDNDSDYVVEGVGMDDGTPSNAQLKIASHREAIKQALSGRAKGVWVTTGKLAADVETILGGKGEVFKRFTFNRLMTIELLKDDCLWETRFAKVGRSKLWRLV